MRDGEAVPLLDCRGDGAGCLLRALACVNITRSACRRATEDNQPQSRRSAGSVSVLRQADKRGVGGIARPAPFRECQRPREQ